MANDEGYDVNDYMPTSDLLKAHTWSFHYSIQDYTYTLKLHRGSNGITFNTLYSVPIHYSNLNKKYLIDKGHEILLILERDSELGVVR